MQLSGNSKLMRIFLGESNKTGHQLLYENIVHESQKKGLAGCTVIKGIMSYGASSVIHTAKLIDLSEDLPIVVEIADTEEKINDFIPVMNSLFEESGCGGMITVEDIQVIYYKPKK